MGPRAAGLLRATGENFSVRQKLLRGFAHPIRMAVVKDHHAMKQFNSRSIHRASKSLKYRARTIVLGGALLCASLAGNLTAQTPQTVATGLLRPAKIIQSPLGNMLVAEVGTAAPNTSRISIIDADGNRRTLIDGLPSANNAVNVLSGVSGLDLRGRTLFAAIGEGNPTLPGPVPRTEIVNPNPASPLFSCVIAVHFSAKAEKETTGIHLTVADHQALKDGERLARFDAGGQKITIELVVDFPDYVAEPVPALATNVRHSHPYGVAADDEYLYVVDGGYNKVFKAEIISGTFETLTSFANIPNRLFGIIGGPTMEVVPTSIRWNGDQLIVSLLSGFPFPAGTSEVVGINPQTGARTPLIAGLSSAIDAIALYQDVNLVGYLALEYSLAHRAGGPGRLRLFDAAGTSFTTVADGLVTPASLNYDGKTGEAMIGLINPGQLISIPLL
jgi:hypothetical protein